MSVTLEAALLSVVAGLVVVIDSVWAAAPIVRGSAALALSLLLACRVGLVRVLRRRFGRRRLALEPSTRRLVLDGDPPYSRRVWRFDLGRPLLPTGPLLVPGLAFLAWVLVQLVPLPPALAFAGVAWPLDPPAGGAWSRLTVSVPDTLRGLGFLGFALLIHVTAATTLDRRDAQKRFLRAVAAVGLACALLKLFRFAFRTALTDGFFRPTPATDNIFLNRNQFATYMLIVVPLTFGLVASAYRAYRRRVGTFANLRRELLGLSSTEGASLLYASIPAPGCVAALVATTSRGGLLAFAGGLMLAGLASRRGAPPFAWSCVLVFSVMAVSWFGLDRLQNRFARFGEDVPGRTWVWADTLSRMGGHWITGYGFNTFEMGMSRTTAWALPRGATPWTDAHEIALAGAPRAGVRSLESTAGLGWYGSAHNDYIQVLAETGLPGLLVALWAAWRLVAAVRYDPWLLAAVTGVLMHAFVDFSLQVPAVAALFVAVAGMRSRRAP